jgi:hypothetical protein
VSVYYCQCCVDKAEVGQFVFVSETFVFDEVIKGNFYFLNNFGILAEAVEEH